MNTASDVLHSLVREAEWERERVSRDLHDNAAQLLAVIRLQLELIEVNSSVAGFDDIRQTAEVGIAEIRRLIADLSLPPLDKLGLSAALQQLFKRFHEQHASKSRLNINHLPAFDSDLNILIYRLAQRCLSPDIEQLSIRAGSNLMKLSARYKEVKQPWNAFEGWIGLLGGRIIVKNNDLGSAQILIELPIHKEGEVHKIGI